MASFPDTPEPQKGDVFFGEKFQESSSSQQSENVHLPELETAFNKLIEAAENHCRQQGQVSLKVSVAGDIEELVREDEEIPEPMKMSDDREPPADDNDFDVIIISEDEDDVVEEQNVDYDEAGEETSVDDVDIIQEEEFQQVPSEVRHPLIWVRDIFPVDEFYKPIPLAKVPGSLGTTRPGMFPTNWIPKDSEYWNQFLEVLRFQNSIVERSIFDNVPVSCFKFESGRIKASRDHINVILRTGHHDNPPIRSTPIFREPDDESGQKHGIFPTRMIPVDSAYYKLAAQDLYFPSQNAAWIRKPGIDGVEIVFRLGARGHSIFAKRNGSTVHIFPED